MDHFHHRFLESSHVPKADEAEDKPRLPTELLIIIASYVENKKSVRILCRSSRTFREICIPALYSTIDINTARPSHIVLYNTLKNLAYSRMVTHFSIYLVPDETCTGEARVSIRHSGNCTCDDYDQALGNTLLCMSNLQSLNIQCRFCGGGSHTHNYLFKLDAPMLRQFVFRCHGSLSTSNGSIHLLPFMPNVTALALECDARLPGLIPNGTHDALIANTNVAQHLHTMSHSVEHLSNELLASRPIQRLCIGALDGPVLGGDITLLHHSITQSPGRLSHLFMVDLFKWLSDDRELDPNPNPYRHLKFVGTIHIVLGAEHPTYFEMIVLRPLSTLEAIQIGISLRPPYGPFTREEPTSIQPASSKTLFSPGRPFYRLLETIHPTLRRVLLIPRDGHSRSPADPPSILWEKHDVWESREVPYLEYWDLLCDKLDQV